MKGQSKKQKETKNKRIKIPCLKGLRNECGTMSIICSLRPRAVKLTSVCQINYITLRSSLLSTLKWQVTFHQYMYWDPRRGQRSFQHISYLDFNLNPNTIIRSKLLRSTACTGPSNLVTEVNAGANFNYHHYFMVIFSIICEIHKVVLLYLFYGK